MSEAERSHVEDGLDELGFEWQPPVTAQGTRVHLLAVEDRADGVAQQALISLSAQLVLVAEANFKGGRDRAPKTRVLFQYDGVESRLTATFGGDSAPKAPDEDTANDRLEDALGEDVFRVTFVAWGVELDAASDAAKNTLVDRHVGLIADTLELVAEDLEEAFAELGTNATIAFTTDVDDLVGTPV